MFKVMEASTLPRLGKPELNEDALVITPAFVAVIDGETNKGEVVDPSPGRQAVIALVGAISELRASPEPEELVQCLHRAVTAAQESTASAAVIAVLDVAARRIVRVGDITVCVNGVIYQRRKELDRIASEARAAFNLALLEAGASVEDLVEDDPGRKLVLPLLNRAKVFRNHATSPFGFGVIDGTSTPSGLVDIIDLPNGPVEVIFATDGYPHVEPTLEATEAALLRMAHADPLRSQGSPGLKAFNSQTNGYDDRTYLALRV
jgi:hypothetical protein